MNYEGIETKREPTKVELALLELAKAIDRLELAIREQERTLDRTAVMLDVIAKRDEWVDHYRAHASDGIEGL